MAGLVAIHSKFQRVTVADLITTCRLTNPEPSRMAKALKVTVAELVE